MNDTAGRSVLSGKLKFERIAPFSLTRLVKRSAPPPLAAVSGSVPVSPPISVSPLLM